MATTTLKNKPHAVDFFSILETDGGALAMQLSQPPIAFHRVFLEITGTLASALMLSLCFEQEQDTSFKTNADGWMEVSAEYWYQRAAMSVKEQATARRRLRDLRLLEERLAGYPAQMSVRLNWVELGNRLIECSSTNVKRYQEAVLAQTKPAVVH
jgi:hypothetical protein